MAGFTLRLHADAPWGTGLGSSSTHIVAVLGVFSHWLRLGLTDYELAEMAFQLERVDIGQAGGRQDQYSATFGGFNFIEFGENGTMVSPLLVENAVLHELHYRLLLCSLGRTRRSSEILEDQINLYVTNNSNTVEALHNQKRIAYEMKTALLTGNVNDMGSLLHVGWLEKRRVSSLVSNSLIDDVYEDARGHDALGGKVLGAGGGGHMLFLCSEEGKVQLHQRLVSRGLECVGFAFDPNGLTVWESSSG